MLQIEPLAVALAYEREEQGFPQTLAFPASLERFEGWLPTVASKPATKYSFVN